MHILIRRKGGGLGIKLEIHICREISYVITKNEKELGKVERKKEQKQEIGTDLCVDGERFVLRKRTNGRRRNKQESVM